MIPKRDKTTDISSEIAQGKMFRKRLLRLAEEVATRFKDGEGLNQVIADTAIRENFNQLQIQRLIEESNTLAFNKLYDDRRKENDRRISFELGELSEVVRLMGDKAPPEVENPNWVSGALGEGEMKKEASFGMGSSMVTPHSHVERSREKMLAKAAARKTEELEKQSREINREIESGIFKLAQTLIHSERRFNNGNQIFNTLIADSGFDDAIVEGITKKAETLIDHMKMTNRIHSGFTFTPSVDPYEKVASTVLGKHSLFKTASEQKLVEEPKIAPIQNVQDYQQLINLAREIQKKQQQSLAVDTQLHGGATQ